MQCALCGYEFDETLMVCHTSCTFNKGCAIICCPNCGYQMTDESRSRLASALRRIFERRQTRTQQPDGVQPLSALRSGQSARIVAVESDEQTRVERLHILGIVPDAQITLTQKRPEYVLHVGFTELSLERDIVNTILVEVIPSPH